MKRIIKAIFCVCALMLVVFAFIMVPKDEAQKLEFGPFTWIVLDVQDDKMLIITEDVVELRFGHSGVWEKSGVRSYLNGAFLQTFTSEERERIAETPIENRGNLWYGVPGERNTVDMVFLLSLEEVDRYFGNSGDYLNKNRMHMDSATGKMEPSSDGLAISNAYDGDRSAERSWSLRSPGGNSDLAAFVAFDGTVNVAGFATGMGNVGVRPALWLYL